MATEVVMPQMGESIAEGTIVRWIKKVGDAVDRDEPLFEISTDKVDAEIPSPGAGVLLEIRVKEGETVPVNSVVALIGVAGEEPATAPPSSDVGPAAFAPVVASAAADGTSEPRASTVDAVSVAAPAESSSEPRGFSPGGTSAPAQPANDLEARLRTRSSPVVRNIAKEHGVDLGQLNGTGVSGRVTKKDILEYVESGAAARAAAVPAASIGAKPAAPAPAAKSPFAPGENVRIEPMGIMRKKIGDHMVSSIRTSPHVYSAYEVDFSRIDEIRKRRKAEYEAAGAKLTYTAFIAKATVDTIRQFPFTNASIDGDNIVYKRDINLGIAVALDQGLIVPVIRNADEKNMVGVCRAIQDLSGRARSKQLKPDEVQGGTFTITNPGIFGAVFGLPIISQPQVAILGVGSVDKRVVVVDDMIAIRPVCYFTLGYDHRLIDGADAGRFLLALKERLQDFDESWV